MLRYSLIFLVLALFSLALGFWALAGMAALIARILLLIFVLLFVASLFSRGRNGDTET